MYMKRKFSELVNAIRDTVRLKAQEIPKFKESGNGAIRILAYPCSAKADYWFGGDGFKKNDIADYERTYAISPGGSRVIKGIWDGVEQVVDCYAYSALKIAHCSRVQDKGRGLLSGIELDDPTLVEENGFSSHRGALCVEIDQGFDFYRSMSGEILPTTVEKFCSLYVCVSGADSNDDLRCAFAAVDVIKKFFNEENKGFIFNTPSLPKDLLSEELG